MKTGHLLWYPLELSQGVHPSGLRGVIPVCLFVSVSPHVYRTDRAGIGLCSRGRPTSFFPSPSLPPAGICIRGNFPFLYLKWEEKVLQTFSVFVFLRYIEKARGGTCIWSEELDLGPIKSKMVQRVTACSQQRTQ